MNFRRHHNASESIFTALNVRNVWMMWGSLIKGTKQHFWALTRDVSTSPLNCCLGRMKPLYLPPCSCHTDKSHHMCCCTCFISESITSVVLLNWIWELASRQRGPQTVNAPFSLSGIGREDQTTALKKLPVFDRGEDGWMDEEGNMLPMTACCRMIKRLFISLFLTRRRWTSAGWLK